ncbi:SRPBCC family protein [Bacillus sp. EAC]|uniref:SRPBCC family protein n=1 Tax=Bacillus sp. EAC TaxID=1978338 RepID=UPI000B447DD3|nr:SRPBCC family protein [Bacillus sp. EAC]
MIQWKEEILIERNIEKVWSLFSDKNIKKIMPKVEEHILIEKNENEVGAKHSQSYREGNRVESYIVDTLAYEDKENNKKKQISFVLANAFETNLIFQLIKIDETHTKFIYEGTNKGVNFVGRAMLKLGNKKGAKKVVEDFLNRVEQEALNL